MTARLRFYEKILDKNKITNLTGLVVSEQLTNGIRVQVSSRYVPEQSHPLQPLYVFSYHVTISNESEHTVQLISRYWKIRDAFSRIEDVVLVLGIVYK